MFPRQLADKALSASPRPSTLDGGNSGCCRTEAIEAVEEALLALRSANSIADASQHVQHVHQFVNINGAGRPKSNVSFLFVCYYSFRAICILSTHWKGLLACTDASDLYDTDLQSLIWYWLL